MTVQFMDHQYTSARSLYTVLYCKLFYNFINLCVDNKTNSKESKYVYTIVICSIRLLWKIHNMYIYVVNYINCWYKPVNDMSEKQPPDLSMEHLPQNTENRKEHYSFI